MKNKIKYLEDLCEMLNSNPNCSFQEVSRIIENNEWINEIGIDDFICTDCRGNLLYYNRETRSHSILYSWESYTFLTKNEAIYAAHEFAEKNNGHITKIPTEKGRNYFEIKNDFKIMYDTTYHEIPKIVDIIYVYSNKYDSIIGLFAYSSCFNAY